MKTPIQKIDEFLRFRFGSVTDDYRSEWMQRFANGTAWNMADSDTRKVMEEMGLHHNQMQTK